MMTLAAVAAAFWLVCGLIAAAVANSRGANGSAAFVAGALLGPVGIVISFLMRPAVSSAVRAAPAEGGFPPGYGRSCPFCASTIAREMPVCKYCRRESSSSPLPPFIDVCGRAVFSNRHDLNASHEFPGFVACKHCKQYFPASVR